MANHSARGKGVFPAAVAALVGCGLVFCSQTCAFAWDEGFHLLAAQLILGGKRPYLDFVFSQAPLNAYWNALWMRLLGDTWRVAHLAAALCSAGAIFLTADYCRRRFGELRFGPAAAVLAALLLGLNAQVVNFGTIGQAYGFCLLLLTGGFRAAVGAVKSRSWRLAFTAGLLCGASADASLLTLPAAAIVLLWLLIYEGAGARWTKGAAYAGGVLAGFAPLAWLFRLSPRNVIFGVLEYQMHYREVEWEGAGAHNLDVYLSWIDSPQALVLGVLAIAGAAFVHWRSGWSREQRGEFYLCLWLALGLGAFVSIPHPTFERYYIFLLPFAAILAAAGMYWLAERFQTLERPVIPVLAAVLLTAAGLGKTLYDGRDDFRWSDFDPMLELVAREIPREAPILADEQIYFLSRRTPPEGMEEDDTHKLHLGANDTRSFHLMPMDELDRRMMSGRYPLVEFRGSPEHLERLHLESVYRRRTTFEAIECTVFWDPARHLP